MSKISKMDRRSFIYGQMAVASTLGLGSLATAFGQPHGPNPDANNLLGLDAFHKPSWKTGTADQFARLINQPFTAMTDDGNMLHLKLVKAEAGNSGPARPKHLPRSESVSLIFKSDSAAELFEQGHQSVWITNGTLGTVNLFLGAIPLKSGGYEIEAILN